MFVCVCVRERERERERERVRERGRGGGARCRGSQKEPHEWCRGTIEDPNWSDPEPPTCSRSSDNCTSDQEINFPGKSMSRKVNFLGNVDSGPAGNGLRERGERERRA